jgi:hypothetical protein
MMLTLLLFASFVVLDGMCGKVPHFQICDGGDDAMEHMLNMRENLVSYVHLIDIYAPCIVGKSKWNDVANMTRYCGDSMELFNEHVFSISDEAFLLIVLFNYTKTWTSEIAANLAKVRLLLLMYTFWCCCHTLTPCMNKFQANAHGSTPIAVAISTTNIVVRIK